MTNLPKQTLRQVRLKLLESQAIRQLAKRTGYHYQQRQSFGQYHYQRHTQRRLEHLASLHLALANSTVLEVGAGLGDHTSFFLDRQCKVVSTDARQENLQILQERYPDLTVQYLDLDHPEQDTYFVEKSFDIIHCYGLLYHLQNPTIAIDFMAKHCSGILLLESCVSFGEDEAVNSFQEVAEEPVNSVWGWGCHPTRRWVFNQLQADFPYVYMPTTQPNHEEFPIDWTLSSPSGQLSRAIFIASRYPIDNPYLSSEIPMMQRYH